MSGLWPNLSWDRYLRANNISEHHIKLNTDKFVPQFFLFTFKQLQDEAT